MYILYPQHVNLYIPLEKHTHRKVNLESAPLCPTAQRELEKPCKEYKDISLHQVDTSHMKLLTMDIDTRGHPSIAENCIPKH